MVCPRNCGVWGFKEQSKKFWTKSKIFSEHSSENKTVIVAYALPFREVKRDYKKMQCILLLSCLKEHPEVRNTGAKSFFVCSAPYQAHACVTVSISSLLHMSAGFLTIVQ